MLPKELSKEEFIKLLKRKKLDVNVHKFVNSVYKMYIVDSLPVMILEKQVYTQNGLTIYHKYLDYFSIENISKMISKYAKKYGRDEIVVTLPYSVVIDMLEEFK